MAFRIVDLDLSNDDLNQRYRDTYIQVLLGKDLTPTVVYSMPFSGNCWYYKTETSGQLEHPRDEVIVERDFPQMGAVNLDGSVHVITINPARQWHRGLCKSRIKIFTRNEHAVLAGSIGFPLAEALFNRKYIHPTVGLNLLRQHEIHSFAMNNLYWYSGNSRHIYLWRNTVCVGELVGNKVFFSEASSLLVDEIRDDLKDIHG